MIAPLHDDSPGCSKSGLVAMIFDPSGRNGQTHDEWPYVIGLMCVWVYLHVRGLFGG